jgi:hypothetical protein
MIDPKELRMGNYVIYEATNHIVTSVSESLFSHQWWKHFPYGDTYSCDQDDIDPISLTSEILEKCGFVQMIDSNNKYEQRYQGNADLNFGYPVLYLNEYEYLSQNCATPNGYLWLHNFRIKCIFLHQLQNLYFALTGTELNYQP